MGWMLDSPLVRELLARRARKDILIVLEARLGPVPACLVSRLHAIPELESLERLLMPAVRCRDLETFAAVLPEIDQPFVVATPKSE